MARVPSGRGPLRPMQVQVDETLVEGRWILAVQGDHLGPRLAAADDLEGVSFYALDDSVRPPRFRLTGETQFRPGTVTNPSWAFCRSGVHRHDMHPLALQFPAKGLPNFAKPPLTPA